jgi:uncharacterized DUF497 family protein
MDDMPDHEKRLEGDHRFVVFNVIANQHEQFLGSHDKSLLRLWSHFPDRRTHHDPAVMRCIYNRVVVFDWDENNLRKIRAHRTKSEEVEQGLSNSPILIHEQDVQGELRYVYYCETNSGRMLAVILIERAEQIRVVTAYDLDAGQKREYLARRVRGE